MHPGVRSVASIACAVVMGIAVPAHASPKTDCEKGLEQAQKIYDNYTGPYKKKGNLGKILDDAIKDKENKKYKKCIKQSNTVREKLG